MIGQEDSAVLIAIAELKLENKHLEDYIYNELKPDIQKLCNKVTLCMEKAESCSLQNFKWMIATLLTAIVAMMGWISFVIMLL